MYSGRKISRLITLFYVLFNIQDFFSKKDLKNPFRYIHKNKFLSILILILNLKEIKVDLLYHLIYPLDSIKKSHQGLDQQEI
jgi:hypothetical protein